MNHLCFGVPIKPTCDVAVDRPVFVTAGMDSFHTILIGRGTGKGSEAGIGDNKAQSSLATTDSDVATYITSSTVNKETWGRFETTLVGVYGAPDPEAGRGKSTAVSTGSRVGEEGGGSAGVEAAIEYPEDDIDEARSSRNMALEQYIQDAARREKMSARSGLSSDMGSGTGTGNNDDEDEGMGGGRKVSGRSAGNSKNDLSTLDRDRDRDARDRDRDARDNNSNSNIKSNSTAYNQESEFDDRRNGRARK